MKTRFDTYDIICGVAELQRLIGLRVNQIYDVDNKTYLIRLQEGETKYVLLLESGIRFHTTSFEWPKNVAPSGFSMKLRKHLKNKRLEKLEQLGVDRIVDFQFGSGEAAYHVILELYDRGNIILTDYELTILNILRPHVEGEEIKFAVREKYPKNRAKIESQPFGCDEFKTIIANAKPGENLRRLLTPILDCGPAVIEHVLLKHNLNNVNIGGESQASEDTTEESSKGHGKKGRKFKKRELNNTNCRPFNLDTDLPNLISAIGEANQMLIEAKQGVSKGYIIQKKEAKPTADNAEVEYFYHSIEYHPYLFAQHKDQTYKEIETFMQAVDEFHSTLEGQKIDLKAIQQEKEALKKLFNVRQDHAKRLEELSKLQEEDKKKAELITRNQALVDNAILAVRSAIANQMSWPDIHELVKAAQTNGDPVASAIKQLKLEINHIALHLHDPYQSYDSGSENEDEDEEKLPSMTIDVDLALSAFANARKYYDQKRNAAKKEQRTIDASQKALKSAEKKTQQTLKEVRTITTISKARKVYWFEKFYWFISSENYLVIGGRDSQQNELIVKKYMRPTDIYVHAEIQGASSIVIKNPTGNDVPLKTLIEAGYMAISYSVAWDAKVVTNAYWVKSDQVSKTAPTGEYLGTGSFMIRGKKNFLPPCNLIMGISVLFKLEDSSIERHRGERPIRTFDEDTGDKLQQFFKENEKLETVPEEEIKVEDSDNQDEENDEHSKENKDNKKTPSVSSESEEEDSNFPDTHIKIDHNTGQVMVQLNKEEFEGDLETKETVKKDNLASNVDHEKSYIIPQLPTRKKQQPSRKKKEEKKHKSNQEFKRDKFDEKKSSQPKRGQRGKLKKIKSKYKDQDEEERKIRMEILKSAGADKVKDNLEKEDDQEEDTKIKKYSKKPVETKQQDDDELDDTPAGADVEMLDSLTGQPIDEDELLFAIPIIAPYQTLHNYKYKIKLTPGTTRRGKAAKTALLMFSKDKSCTSREKDLFKSIKEEALARNIPGKVKLSAPQLQKFKK